MTANAVDPNGNTLCATNIIHLKHGDVLNLDEPSIASIDIRDIASHLGKTARFNGGTDRFYSVAEHCIWVSNLVPDQFALEGLLHDAAEAYLGDVIRPLKVGTMFDEYRAMERRLDLVIADRFGLIYGEAGWPIQVDAVDKLIVKQESVNLRPWLYENKFKSIIPAPFDKVVGRITMGPAEAEAEFLRRYEEVVDRDCQQYQQGGLF